MQEAKKGTCTFCLSDYEGQDKMGESREGQRAGTTYTFLGWYLFNL